MKIIKPSFEILDKVDGNEMLRKIELAARTCYKSEDKITDDSAERFVRNLIQRGHESALEHEKVTVRIICDRGVSHEIVRHRLGSYSMESTRYVCYDNGKNSREMTFIKPCFLREDSVPYNDWKYAMRSAEDFYIALISNGCSPQEARSVLPNSLKTEIVMTANLREWRHFFRLRCAPDAHPQMREIATMMLEEFRKLIPVIFDNLNTDNCNVNIKCKNNIQCNNIQNMTIL